MYRYGYGIHLVIMTKIVVSLTVDLMSSCYVFPLQIQHHYGIAWQCGIRKFDAFARKRRSFWSDAKMICDICTAMKLIYHILAIKVHLLGNNVHEIVTSTYLIWSLYFNVFFGLFYKRKYFLIDWTNKKERRKRMI